MSSSKNPGKPKGVLLDIDGTLLDSNDAHAHAFVEAFAAIGVSLDFQRVRRLIGKGGEKLIPEVAGVEPGSLEFEKVNSEKKKIFFSKYLPDLRPFPHARELVQRFKRDDLACVIASSAGGDEVQTLLEAAHVADLIDTGASSGDASRSKPDPDIVTAAIAKAGIPARHLLMLGDTPYDVEAGRRAGVQVVGLECGGWKAADLKGALAVYAHPGDLLKHYEESPFRP